MRPHASWLMERFSPDFWATFFPGSSTVYTDSEAELKQFNGEQDHIRRYLGQYIENQESPI